jgi:hypothetical protein
MAGFGASPSSKPAIEMAGFGSRKYQPTVSRLIPNSFAIRRCDHPHCANLYIVVCRLTLRTFDMPFCAAFTRLTGVFSLQKVAGFEALISTLPGRF